MPFGPAEFPAVSSVDASNPLAADPACHAEVERQTPNLRILHTLSTVPCLVRLTLYFYPYWRAIDESDHSLVTSRESTGFLLIEVPPGSHTVSLSFHPASPVRTASAIISLVTLLLLACAFLLKWPIDVGFSRARTTLQVP